MSMPKCPKCNSEYVYQDIEMYICPECSFEFTQADLDSNEDESNNEYRDSNGNLLKEDDKVTLIKDLKVKGSSQVLKIGTKAIIKRFVDGDHDIDCKVDGSGNMMLKSKFVKKN